MESSEQKPTQGVVQQEKKVRFFNDPPEPPKITHEMLRGENCWWVGINTHFPTQEEAEKFRDSLKPELPKRNFSMPDGSMTDEVKKRLLTVGIAVVDHNNFGTRGWHYELDDIRLRLHRRDYESGAESPDERRAADPDAEHNPDIFEIHGPDGKASGVFVNFDPIGRWLYVVQSLTLKNTPE